MKRILAAFALLMAGVLAGGWAAAQVNGSGGVYINGVLQGVGGGTGTVTSVGLTLPSFMNVSGTNPITTSGTFTLGLANVSSTLAFLGPATGSPAAPTFRAIATTDLASPDASGVLTSNGSGALSWSAAPATGANTALSNLASIAIDTTDNPKVLNPASDGVLGLGSTAYRFNSGWFSGAVYSSVLRSPVLEQVAPTTDNLPGASLVKAGDAFPGAATNTTGANTILAGGIGKRIFTVVAYDNATVPLSTVTITVNGTATVKTEGTDWFDTTGNNEMATSLASAINGISGVSATASSAVVRIVPGLGTYSLTIAKTAADAGMTATSGTDGGAVVYLGSDIGIKRYGSSEAIVSNGILGGIGSLRVGTLTTASPTPTGTPVITQGGTGGATTYYYATIAIQADGQKSAASAWGTTTTGAASLNETDYNIITFTPVAGAVSYDIYEYSKGKIISACTTSPQNDTGLAGDSQQPPATLAGKLIIGNGGDWGNGVPAITFSGGSSSKGWALRAAGQGWIYLGGTPLEAISGFKTFNNLTGMAPSYGVGVAGSNQFYFHASDAGYGGDGGIARLAPASLKFTDGSTGWGSAALLSTKFFDGGTHYTTIQAQTQAADITWTLPPVANVSGALRNDGTGSLTWGHELLTDQFTYTFFDLNTDLPATLDVPSIYVNRARAIHITELYCEIDAGSATINLTKNGSNIATADITCAVTPSGTDGTTGILDNSGSHFVSTKDAIAVGDKIGHVMVTVGASLKRLNVVAKYVVD